MTTYLGKICTFRARLSLVYMLLSLLVLGMGCVLFVLVPEHCPSNYFGPLSMD